ncbi:hypothetical protein I6A84_02185 [Frankia sp. CNm7]|uniref:hypothetical protein n=1 Tax=Frankia nepalensis TaxID=1836974 RepID=UPI0019313A22|nr:hypothetical protein [Frankia nepalensis]MBL7516966.1 hypothetical protein [Frankia nepalensis]
MPAVLQALLESTTAGLIWVVAIAVGVTASFVLYIGLALGVALFHPDDKVRRHAAAVLRQLLGTFVRLVRRCPR